MMIGIVQLLRPHQWLKNIFIFLPLFFAGYLLHTALWKESFVVFFAFSFIASSIYAFNDILDIDADRCHPKKNKRPLASGILNKSTGYIIMVLALFTSLSIVFVFAGEKMWQVIAILLFYFFMNIAYTIKLKHYPLIDVCIIALGFVLRVVVGGIATGIELSHWIILMTFLLALFLAFAKRRDDVILFQETGVQARKKIDRYNLDLMNQFLTILGGITIVCYIMYTVSEEVIKRLGNNHVYITALFVLLGIFRYLQLTLVDLKSGSPTKILMKDFFVQLCILGWLSTFIIIIYFR